MPTLFQGGQSVFSVGGPKGTLCCWCDPSLSWVYRYSHTVDSFGGSPLRPGVSACPFRVWKEMCISFHCCLCSVGPFVPSFQQPRLLFTLLGHCDNASLLTRVSTVALCSYVTCLLKAVHPTVQVVAPLVPRTKDPLSTWWKHEFIARIFFTKMHWDQKRRTKPVSPLEGPPTPFIASPGVHELS